MDRRRGSNGGGTSTRYETPLHVAASQLDVSICRLLLKFKASGDVLDKDLKTPWDRANELDGKPQCDAVQTVLNLLESYTGKPKVRQFLTPEPLQNDRKTSTSAKNGSKRSVLREEESSMTVLGVEIRECDEKFGPLKANRMHCLIPSKKKKVGKFGSQGPSDNVLLQLDPYRGVKGNDNVGTISVWSLPGQLVTKALLVKIRSWEWNLSEWNFQGGPRDVLRERGIKMPTFGATFKVKNIMLHWPFQQHQQTFAVYFYKWLFANFPSHEVCSLSWPVLQTIRALATDEEQNQMLAGQTSTDLTPDQLQ